MTKPTAWRGGKQILKNEEEDAKPLTRCEEKRKEWAKHWQCGTEVQDLKDKPWRSEELKKLEEDMPRFKESDLAKAAKNYKAKRETGAMTFTQKFRWIVPEKQEDK